MTYREGVTNRELTEFWQLGPVLNWEAVSIFRREQSTPVETRLPRVRACRWYRDPALPVPRTEITRFPHGVLEVKLSLPEGQKAPEWVQDLLESGYLTEARPPGCALA